MISPSLVPELPSEATHTLFQLPSGVGVVRDFTVSIAALAADAAEDAPRA